MFGFLNMMYTYESRKVARTEKGKLLVSTAMVTDSQQPYETVEAFVNRVGMAWPTESIELKLVADKAVIIR